MKDHWIVGILLTLLIPNLAQGQSNARRESLRGLGGVEVLVEKIDPQAERFGLTQSQVQTDTELRLRKAGIRVLSEENTAKQGSPFLYVNINTSEAKEKAISGVFSYSIVLELRQRVILERDTSIRVMGTTWTITSKGVVGQNKLPSLREIVADYVDEFINDYLAVNQR